MIKFNLKVNGSFIAFVTLAFFSCKSGNNPVVQRTTLVKRDINREVVFSAKISPSEISSVYSTVNGTVESVNKIPGAIVNKGDVIITLRDNNNGLHDIAAKEAGVLIALNYSTGEYINGLSSQSMPVFITGQDRKKIIAADVDEMDASKIIAGDTVLIYSKDSFSLAGKIDFINLIVTTTNGEARFKLGGHLDDPSRQVMQFGNMVPVKVVRRLATNILSVESNYLVKRNNKIYLKIMKNNKVEEKEVVIGVENENYTEIKSGAAEGEIIVL